MKGIKYVASRQKSRPGSLLARCLRPQAFHHRGIPPRQRRLGGQRRSRLIWEMVFHVGAQGNRGQCPVFTQGRFRCGHGSRSCRCGQVRQPPEVKLNTRGGDERVKRAHGLRAAQASGVVRDGGTEGQSMCSARCSGKGMHAGIPIAAAAKRTRPVFGRVNAAVNGWRAARTPGARKPYLVAETARDGRGGSVA